MPSVTYTLHYALAKPYKGQIDWDPLTNGDFDTIDTELYRSKSNLDQIASDLYQSPAGNLLTADTNGTSTVTVGVGNTTNYAAGDLIQIYDDNTAPAQYYVSSVNAGAGTVIMNSSVPATFTISQNAMLQRLNGRLNSNGLAVLPDRVLDLIQFTKMFQYNVDGSNRKVAIAGSYLTKGDGSIVDAFLDTRAGYSLVYAGGNVYFDTGVVEGGGDNFTPPSIGSDYQTALICITTLKKLVIYWGTQAATYADARLSANRAVAPDSTTLGICRVTLRGDGVGGYKFIRKQDIEDCRAFLNLTGAATNINFDDMLVDIDGNIITNEDGNIVTL